MNRVPVFFHPEALEELDRAIAWYAEKSSRAAERLLQEVRTAAKSIAEFQHRHPEFEAGSRRATLRNFPYSVIYMPRSDGIEIIAVAHGRRRPGYWRTRIGEFPSSSSN